MGLIKIKLDDVVHKLINAPRWNSPYVELSTTSKEIIIDGMVTFDELIELSNALREYVKAVED